MAMIIIAIAIGCVEIVCEAQAHTRERTLNLKCACGALCIEQINKFLSNERNEYHVTSLTWHRPWWLELLRMRMRACVR